MRRATLLVLVATALSITGCDGGTEDAGTTAPNDSTESLDAFCAAMAELTTTIADPVSLEGLYQTIEEEAPAEIRQDASEFLANSRAVSAAFVAAGAPEREVDAAAIVASLPPEQQRFVAELAEATGSGVVPDSSVGRFLEFVFEACPDVGVSGSGP